jgi:hypothetical protein
MKAEVTKTGMLDMQVCVPNDWTDDEIKAFADRENLAGTETGWHIRREGSKYLNGAKERVDCTGRVGFVHVMLDC